MTGSAEASVPPSPIEPLGLFRFTIEGRVAPGLFVAGWLATIVGAGVALIGFLSTGSVAGAVLFTIGLAVLSVGLFLLAGSQTVERRRAGLAYGGPSPVLVLAAVVSTTYLAAIVIGVPLELVGARGLPRPVADLVGAIVQALVFVGVVRALVVASHAISWREMGFGIPAGAAVAAALGGAVLAVPIVLVTALLASVLVPLLGASPQSPLPPTGTLAGTVLHLIAGALVVPVAEEVTFRGMATTAWDRAAGARAAIVRGGLLFALAHVLFVGGGTFREAAALAVVAAAGRLPVAFALGWIYLRRRTIWASIGMHAAFNAILIVLGEMAVRGAAGVGS